MDDIIEKIQNINKYLGLLNDTDKTQYITENEIIINKLQNNVNDLYNLIIVFKPSKEKIDQLELKNKKDKIFAKSLFPCYWALSECFDKMSEKEIDEINNNDFSVDN
jgi:hypothetical protein